MMDLKEKLISLKTELSARVEKIDTDLSDRKISFQNSPLISKMTVSYIA